MSLIIKAENINVEYNSKEILAIDELEIYEYDSIGLIGDNGTGKTTLLKILSGELVPEGAKLQCHGEVSLIRQNTEKLEETEADGEQLSRFGIDTSVTKKLSGGEGMRLKIAAAFSRGGHLLLADEPTNNLDTQGIALLIDELGAFPGAKVIVSHDRYFLDQAVNKIWELKDGVITEFWGGYSDYLAQKEEEERRQAQAYAQAQEERDRLAAAIAEKEKQARAIDRKEKGKARKNANESTGRLGHQKSTGSKQKKLHRAAQQLEKRMAELDDVAAPNRSRGITFRQSEALTLHNKFPIICEDVNLAYGERVIFDHASFEIPLGKKVAIGGPNGSGKTSLFKLILGRAPGLLISPKAAFGYFEQGVASHNPRDKVLSFLQDAADYPVHVLRAGFHAMGFAAADINKELAVLSGGELVKLHLLRLLFGRYNILLMDEPGNDLDLATLAALEQMMQDYTGTILFVSHDKRLVDNVADIVYVIEDKKLVKVREGKE